ncbi:MAG: hypothetical protein K2H74_00645 [Paramuribaculum sp.]|nr:hypothetical protein [Paramuribaculum sp.]
MKKLIFLIVCVCTLGFASVNALATETASQDAPMCQQVGNVSAEINNNGNGKLINYNNYTVTVYWTVYGHRPNGTKSEVGGGSKVLGTGTQCSAPISFTPSSEYTSYSISINVQQCN